MYTAERIIACLKLLLRIIDGYEIEYNTYREDDYINIINDTISLYDNMDDLDKVNIDILEFTVDNYDIWIDMLNKFGNLLKELDFSDEFPICNDNDKELIFNSHDALDVLKYISSISREDEDFPE